MLHLPPSWCSSNFPVQWSDHCDPIDRSITCIFSSMLRIRKLCCSKCISWNLLPSMASVDVPCFEAAVALYLVLVHHPHVYNKLQEFWVQSHCMIQSAFQLLSQHQPCPPFLKSNIWSLFLFVLCKLLSFHNFFCMIPKFWTKSTVTSSKV